MTDHERIEELERKLEQLHRIVQHNTRRLNAIDQLDQKLKALRWEMAEP